MALLYLFFSKIANLIVLYLSLPALQMHTGSSVNTWIITTIVAGMAALGTWHLLNIMKLLWVARLQGRKWSPSSRSTKTLYMGEVSVLACLWQRAAKALAAAVPGRS